MFYMPGTRMLFGDAKVTTEGEIASMYITLMTLLTTGSTAIKSAIEARS
jgi:hypothetical protein